MSGPRLSLPEGSVDHEAHHPVAVVRFSAPVHESDRIVVEWNDSRSIKDGRVGVTGKVSGYWIPRDALKERFTTFLMS